MWTCSEFYFLRHVQLSASPVDLQQWLLSSQWRGSELQWEPKQLLQPVLVASCPPQSMMLMHGLCGVSWRSNKSRFSQANSPFPLNWPLPRSSFTLPLHIPPCVRWGWICKWNGGPLTRTQCRTGISIRLSALLETNSNWGTFCAGGGCERGGKAVYCLCDDPDILEQPRGASLCAALCGIWENLITE